jgi:hypothetical protein
MWVTTTSDMLPVSPRMVRMMLAIFPSKFLGVERKSIGVGYGLRDRASLSGRHQGTV